MIATLDQHKKNRKAKNKMDRKLKVGDKLVVKKKFAIMGRISCGDLLTVTKLWQDGFFVDTDSISGVYFSYNRVGEFLAFVDEAEQVEARTYREKLAEKIYLAAFASQNRIFQHDAFKAADAFIEERDRQRQRDSSAIGAKVDISA